MNYPARVDFALAPFDLWVRGSEGDPATEENEMKYMLIMRATDEAFANFANVDFDEILETHGQVQRRADPRRRAASRPRGSTTPQEGVVVDFTGEPPVVTDGPYGETKELFGGFYILDVASKEEAVEWAKRAPLTAGHARPRSAGCRASTSSRRTTSGSRRSGRGGSRPASSEPAGRTA